MPTMLTEIVGQIDGGLTERFGSLLRADAAATERAVDASVPAILAGLAQRASREPAVILDAVTTYGHLGAGSELDDAVSGGEAIADIAFAESVQTVVDGIAAHLEAAPADVASLIAETSGVVGSYLAARVASDDLDAAGLAALLANERAGFDEVGLGPLLTQWGLAAATKPDDANDAVVGFQYDANAGRPAGLWWVTGLITLVLFAIAISQCGSAGRGDLQAASDSSAASTTPTSTTVAAAIPEPEVVTIGDVAADDGRFSTLLAALEAGGLREALSGEGPLTLFAPTDDAFAALPDGVIDALLENPTSLSALLGAHLVPREVTSAELAGSDVLEMASGDLLDISAAGGSVQVGGAVVVEPDIEADNGILYVIDTVIVPEGFVLPGLVADLTTIAAEAGDFTTLLAALDTAGLVSILEGDGPFTVFGPDDDAFDALPAGTVETLLDRPDDLAEVLLYHVVGGEVRSDDLLPGTELTTIQGETLSVAGAAGAIDVGRARILEPDVEAANGILHVIDAILLPASVFSSGEPTINYVLALEPVTFATSSAQITPEGQTVLDLAVAYLLENPVDVEIQGHTDSDGSEASNQALSEARATAVLEYLVANGVDEAALTASGFGESQPVADNDTAEGRAQNRRIEFRVVG